MSDLVHKQIGFATERHDKSEFLTAMLLNNEFFSDVTLCLSVLTVVLKNLRNVDIYQLTRCNIREDLNFRVVVTYSVMMSSRKNVCQWSD